MRRIACIAEFPEVDVMSLSSAKHVRAAFTLIEVLVVVAIIALLVAILLPSLKQARENAKVSVCLSNLNAINKGAQAYIINEKDRFPFSYTNESQDPTYANGPSWWSSFYGGNTTSDYGDQQVTPDKKPLNKYVYSAKVGSAITPAGTSGPLHVYECPSDDGARWNTVGTSQLQNVKTCYQDIGTSYDQVSTWYYYVDDWEKNQVSGLNVVKRRWDIVKRYVPIMRKKGASRSVLFYEDVADYALSTGMAQVGTSIGFPNVQNGGYYRVMGWHGRYDFASLAFLDGHAAYLSLDWRYVRPQRMSPTSKGHTATWAVHHDVGD
jgi:prepilin-type N-terminal cleavage/methylation domain-containing protein